MCHYAPQGNIIGQFEKKWRDLDVSNSKYILCCISYRNQFAQHTTITTEGTNASMLASRTVWDLPKIPHAAVIRLQSITFRPKL